MLCLDVPMTTPLRNLLRSESISTSCFYNSFILFRSELFNWADAKPLVHYHYSLEFIKFNMAQNILDVVSSISSWQMVHKKSSCNDYHLP